MTNLTKYGHGENEWWGYNRVMGLLTGKVCLPVVLSAYVSYLFLSNAAYQI
jgi:hypothetical protein